MRTQARKMPFTEEQMQQIYNTNLINFAVRHVFEIENGDSNTVHVKHSGGLYLFKHGRSIISRLWKKSREGNWSCRKMHGMDWREDHRYSADQGLQSGFAYDPGNTAGESEWEDQGSW